MRTRFCGRVTAMSSRKLCWLLDASKALYSQGGQSLYRTHPRQASASGRGCVPDNP